MSASRKRAIQRTIAHRDTPTADGAGPGEVVVEATSQAALTFTPSGYETLLKDPDLQVVVRGVVTAVEYQHDAVGTAYTLVTLAVDDAVLGNAGKTVTYMELGGFMRMSDLPKINGSKEGVPEFKQDEWVDMRFLGAPHSQVSEEQL